MNREQITEGLKMLKSYEVAVREYESNRLMHDEDKYSAAPCRVAIYSDMPKGAGSGSRAPKLTGAWMMADYLEYERCLHMSQWMRAALEALTVQERTLMEYKYLDGYSLKQAGEKMHFHEQKAKNLHGSSLRKMEVSLKFIDNHVLLQPA
jgi:hypothetical protein